MRLQIPDRPDQTGSGAIRMKTSVHARTLHIVLKLDFLFLFPVQYAH